jgi:hypothetical protein
MTCNRKRLRHSHVCTPLRIIDRLGDRYVVNSRVVKRNRKAGPMQRERERRPPMPFRIWWWRVIHIGSTIIGRRAPVPHERLAAASAKLSSVATRLRLSLDGQARRCRRPETAYSTPFALGQAHWHSRGIWSVETDVSGYRRLSSRSTVSAHARTPHRTSQLKMPWASIPIKT